VFKVENSIICINMISVAVSNTEIFFDFAYSKKGLGFLSDESF
jgi:hypothetical protein